MFIALAIYTNRFQNSKELIKKTGNVYATTKRKQPKCDRIFKNYLLNNK